MHAIIPSVVRSQNIAILGALRIREFRGGFRSGFRGGFRRGYRKWIPTWISTVISGSISKVDFEVDSKWKSGPDFLAPLTHFTAPPNPHEIHIEIHIEIQTESRAP
eukprot:620739-Pyramimonas_sp.AAC.1